MGTGSSKGINRKRSVKVKRRFSLRRRSSVREPPYRPKYTPRSEKGGSLNYDQSKPEPKPEPIPEAKPDPKPEPNPDPKSELESELLPEVEPRSMPRPKHKVTEKAVDTNLELFIEQLTRRRSLSDGQLPVLLQQLRDAQGHGHDHGQGLSEGHVEVAMAVRDQKQVTRVGYLERRVNSEWNSAWYVLKDNTLYQYTQPIDDVTQDVIQLPGYEVIPCLPSGDRPMFELIHPDGAYVSLELRSDSTLDCDLWMEQLHVATQKLTLDSLSLDTTNSLEQEQARARRALLEDEARKQWQRELFRLKKQQLLREVLLQKEELTRKQVKLGKIKQPSSFEGSLPGSPTDDDSITSDTDDQLLRDRAILKQRKVSMQLKVDMVQKQLQSSTAVAKPKKKFGRKRTDKSGLPGASMSPHQEQLEVELKTLTSELEQLNVQLEQTERRSGSIGQLSSSHSIGGSHRKCADFALNSSVSTVSAASSIRDGTQFDASESRLNRSFGSDPNLLHPTPVDSRLSLRLDSVFSPEVVSAALSRDVSGPRRKFRSYPKPDIPMIDQTPPPEDHHPTGWRHSRHSWDTNNPTPNFLHPSPGSSLGSTEGCTPLSMAGLNKSCDFSLLQSQEHSEDAYRGQVHSSSGGHGASQHTVPRSRSESGSARNRCEISASALAEIAAFEELVQKKMQHQAAVQ